MDVTGQLNLNAGILFSDTRADWTGLNLTTPAYVTDAVMLELYTFEGTNVITTYSDLHYQQTELSLGGTYRFTPALYMTAQAGWQQFVDKSPYVYGDQDGEAYRSSLGVGYRF